MTRSAGSRSTRRTVLVAGAANVVVAAAKLTAGLMTGSSAMLADIART
jgi:divalent metal cation (Fe/Co/Zn/Cd) transporter